MPVAILTQFTPNPNAMKFILNRDVKKYGKLTVRSAEEALNVAMIQELFELGFVEQIHLFENVVTVTKNDVVPWDEAADSIQDVLEECVEEHDPDFELEPQADVSPSPAIERTPDILRIDEILDQTVRPYLQGDGGDLEVVAYAQNRVVVSYEGACGTCPSAITGTLQAIQSILREQLNPEIEVVAVGGASFGP